jgi:hypothetical protein
VAEKWLKDRKGRSTTNDDLEHYHNTVAALVEAVPIVQVELAVSGSMYAPIRRKWRRHVCRRGL